MRSSGCSELPQLENLRKTVIALEVKHPRHSLRKDIIDTITGLSSSAITAGGKIAAETVVYSGESTPSQETAGFVFSVLSLSANVIDFLMIPAGYLYKLYTKEPVPFNLSNNTKWLLAATTLLLAIVSATIVATSRIISFISVGISLATALFTFGKFIYDKKQLLKRLDELDQKIDHICNKISQDMRHINRLQDALREAIADQGNDITLLKPMIITLARSYQDYYDHCEKLKLNYHEKVKCEHALVRLRSPIEWGANFIKVFLAIAVLVGTILSLNPVTLPIGMPIIAAAAISSLLLLIIKKVIQVVQKRRAHHYDHTDDVAIEIEVGNTAAIIKSVNRELVSNPDLRRSKKSVSYVESIPLLRGSIQSVMDDSASLFTIPPESLSVIPRESAGPDDGINHANYGV